MQTAAKTEGKLTATKDEASEVSAKEDEPMPSQTDSAPEKSTEVIKKDITPEPPKKETS